MDRVIRTRLLEHTQLLVLERRSRATTRQEPTIDHGTTQGQAISPTKLEQVTHRAKSDVRFPVLILCKPPAHAPDHSAATNATQSPFLRLPPEIRCRIYDHLFANTAIHIASDEDEAESHEKHYKLSLCGNTQQHTETPLRYVEHHNHAFRKPIPGCTIDQKRDKSVDPLEIGLGLLSVSRQIYHEAVLKPFSQISFSSLSRCYQKYSGVQRFVDSLMPAQAKAIVRLRVVLANGHSRPGEPLYPKLDIGPVPSMTTINKLEGLGDLEIVLAPHIEQENEAEVSLLLDGLDEVFVLAPGMQSLLDLQLRSLRITMEAVFVDEGQGPTPTFTQRKEVEEVKAWLRKTEMQLHFGYIVSAEMPAPRSGVVQDDKAISLPPWATPEGLGETAREAEELRLRREAMLERRRALYEFDQGS